MSTGTQTAQTSTKTAKDTANDAIIGVILAGTHTWQNGGFEMLLPRPLAPVVNVPLILHILHWLRAAGIRTAIICVNRGGQALRGLLGDGRFIDMDLYYHEDRMPRGPAGCARDAAQPFPAGHYVVVEANMIPSVALKGLLARHQQESAEGTIAVGPVAGTRPGVSAQRPSGVYVFGRRAMLCSSRNGYEDLKEGLIPRLYKQNMHVATVQTPYQGPRCQDIGSYIELNLWTLARMRANRSANGRSAWQGDTLIESTAQVATGARIEGPCLIGRGTKVEDGAIIICPTVIGRDCRIAAGSVVRRSVLWDRSDVMPKTRVDGGVFTEFGEFRSRRLN